MSKILRILPLLGILTVLAACSGGEESGADSIPAPPESPAAPPAAPPTDESGQDAASADQAGESAGETGGVEIRTRTEAVRRPEVEVVFAQDAGEELVFPSYEERLERAAIYVYGPRVVDLVVLETLFEMERERRREAGERVGGDVSEEALESKIQETVDAFEAQNPNLDFWEYLAGLGQDPELFRRMAALNLRMIDMFFPDDPDLWPMEQLAVIFEKGENGDARWKPVEDLWKRKKQAKEETGELQPLQLDMVFQFALRPGVFQWLQADAEVETPVDGLPEGVALRVNGKEFTTEELYALVEPMVGPVEQEFLTKWVDTVEAATRALYEDGHWLSRKSFEEVLAAENTLYEGTIFPLEHVAVQMLGFPSMELFRRHFWIRESFRTTLPHPIPTETLEEHASKRGWMFVQGKVDCDVILLPAVDPAALEFSTAPLVFRKDTDDPFGYAKQRADEVAQMLADGEDFDTLLLEYSGFPPKQPGAQGNMPQRDRGRFPAMMWGDLRSFLGESVFTDFLYGHSVGDRIFFEDVPHEIYGPDLGPLGYYFHRVTRRIAPTEEVDVTNNGTIAYQVEDDYVSQRFLDFLNGLRND